mgnify:CR=1 FL=1
MNSTTSAAFITFKYLLLATVWILFSDYLLVLLGLDISTQQTLQTAKGVAFVVVTATLLFFSARHQLRRRRHQEAELKQSEERFHLALTGGNDGLWDWDIATDALYLEPRCREIFGIAPDQQRLLTRDWLSLLHPEDQPAAHVAMMEHLQGRTERLDVQYRVLHPNGDSIWVQAGARGTRSARQGRASGWRGARYQ